MENINKRKQKVVLESNFSKKDVVPSDRTYGEWLRTGEGEMFVKLSKDEGLSAFLGDIMTGAPSFPRRLVSVLARMTEDEWDFLERKVVELAEEIKKDKSADTL